jgi:hypothetical protein
MHITYDFSEFDNCPDWDFKLWPVKDQPTENIFYFISNVSCHLITFKLSSN